VSAARTCGSPTFVSVVVPVYNEERHVEESLRALLEQEHPRDAYEVLVVDNNSTDRSAELVARHPSVRLLEEPVQGDFAARNRGIAAARGEIIAFTDSDTAPRPDWLRRIVEGMGRPEVGVLVGRLEFAGHSRLLALLEAYESEKTGLVFSSEVPETYYGYTCNMAVRRQLFERLGPFAPIFRNADVAFVRRAVDELGCEVAAFCPEMRVRRLEVTSVADYLRKQAVYGRDFPRYAGLANARTLDFGERWRAYCSALRRHRLGPLDAAALLLVLAAGAGCYDAARWWAGRRSGSGAGAG
jgi:cellulose synthase/poly-beta-1,6-N-acetylglucosamine synthase-like glycosyltransferase